MTTSACPLASIGSTVPWPRTPTFNGREIRASAEPGTTDRETRPRPGPGGAAEALTPCGGGAASRRPPGGVLLALRSGPVERARGTPGSGDGARRGGRRARTGRERHTRVSHTRACARVCTRAHTGPHPMSEGYFRVLRSHAQCVTATGDGDRVCVACVSGSASTDHVDSSGRRAPPRGSLFSAPAASSALPLEGPGDAALARGAVSCTEGHGWCPRAVATCQAVARTCAAPPPRSRGTADSSCQLGPRTPRVRSPSALRCSEPNACFEPNFIISWFKKRMNLGFKNSEFGVGY